MRRTSVIATAIAPALLAAPVAAQDKAAETADRARPLAVYAAMAGLETRVAEAAGAVMLGAVPGLSQERLMETASDYTADAKRIEIHQARLETMDLTDAQQQALARFSKDWARLDAKAARLMHDIEDTEAFRDEVYAWWRSVKTADDPLEDAQAAILEAQGIELEG